MDACVLACMRALLFDFQRSNISIFFILVGVSDFQRGEY